MVSTDGTISDNAIQSQRDDREVGRPVTRNPWANFKAVGVRGERESKQK